MQKKLIALAVAGLMSAPAFAQSNVTVYGVADAYMAFGSAGKNDLRGIQSGGLSGSRLGFKGSEDLGNGLKAVFVLEQGFSIDTGNDSDATKQFQRQSYVGLSSSYGTVSLGRQYAPGYDFQYDALVSAAISPQAVLSGGMGSTIQPATAARWDNSAAYNATFGAVKARAIYALGATEVATSDVSGDDRYGLGLEYANGPVKVGAVYQGVKSRAAGADDQKEWLVGGSYDFGVVSLAGSYQAAKALGNVDGADAKLWQLGVIVPVSTAGNVHVAYGRATVDAVAGGSDDSNSWAVAYTHAMSKRTTLYAGYNRTTNDNGLQYGVVGAEAGATGETSNVFVAGMRHTF
jgi:predicted porin